MDLRFIKVYDKCSKSQSLSGLTVQKKEFLRTCSSYELDKYNKSINPKSPHSGNGVYLTGKQFDGSFLLVIDFDKTENTAFDEQFDEFVGKCIRMLEIPKEKLYIVRSGGGGYHFYFDLIGIPQGIEFKNKNYIFLNEKKDFIKSVDFLAEDGLVFTPGSDFRGQENGKNRPHEFIYEIIGMSNEIPKLEFDKLVILNLFIDEMVKIKLIHEQSSEDLDFSERLDLDEVDLIYSLPIRAAFKFILAGKIQVTNEEFASLSLEEGKAKFKIWMALFRELFAKIPKFEENINIFYTILGKSQTEFDLQITRQQIHQAKGKSPITKQVYEKYFEKWLDEILIEEKRVKEAKKESEKLWIKQVAEKAMNEPYYIGYLKENKEFFYFNGKVYDLNSDKVRSIIIDMIMEIGKIGVKHEVNEVLGYIQAKNHHFLKEFDANESYLIFDNGIYDLETRSLIDFNPRYLAFRKFTYAYDPNVTELPEKSKLYLDGLGWSNEEIERFLYISKAIVENKLSKLKLFVVCWGVPDSGKTLWGEKLANMIGESNKDWCLLRFEKFESRFALEPTQFARFVILDDVSVSSMENSVTYGIFKNLTGGRTYELEGKGKSSITQPIRFSIYISCNMLFRLPPKEEIGALLNRAFLFEFKNSHLKELGFANSFLYDAEDNSKLLSYLINLNERPLLEFPRIPINPDVKDTTLTYWLKNANPIYNLCSKYLKKNKRTKVALKSILQVIQAAANEMKYNIDIFTKENVLEIKSYCKKELDAKIPQVKKDSILESQTWVYGVMCGGVPNEPITAIDSMDEIDLNAAKLQIQQFETENDNLLHERILELKHDGKISERISELQSLIGRDITASIKRLKDKRIIIAENEGVVFF